MSEPTSDAKPATEAELQEAWSIFGKAATGGPATGSWEDTATSAFSRWTLSYLTPLLLKGNKSTLEQSDLGKPNEKDLAANSSAAFEEAWKEELEKAAADPTGKYEASVFKAQFRMIGYGNLACSLVYYLVGVIMQFVPVFVLNILVQYLDGTNYQSLTTTHLAIFAVIMLVFPIIGAVAQTQYDVKQVHFGVQCRTAVAVAVYKHALRLTSAARQGVTTGEVVNLFSNDALKVEMFMKFMAFIFIAPIQIAVCLYLIYVQVSHAMWIGLCCKSHVTPLLLHRTQIHRRALRN